MKLLNRLVLVIAVCVCMAATTGEPAPSCKDFKTGKYQLTDEKMGKSFRIERSDTLQIETDLSTGNSAKFRIHWVSDCVYELVMTEGEAAMMNFFNGKILTVKILQTDKESYTYEAQLAGMDLKVVNRVQRVR